MRSLSYKSNLKIIVSLILSVFTPVAGGVFLDRFLSDWKGIDESIHSIVESMGIFIVVPLSVLILYLQQTKRVPSYYIWVSGGLLSIGVLDLVHTFYDIFPALGNSLFNRHAVSILVGSSLFILVWLPSRAAQSRQARALPVAMIVSVIALSIFSSAFPGTLYATTSRGVLAALINGMSSLGGLFFLLAAVFFIIRYRASHRSDDLLLINFCLLNSGIGLMLQFSQPWHADWWFLHLLRLSAYFIMISYTFIAFLSVERELTQINTSLKAEIVERRSAEEALKKERDNAQKYFNVAGIILIVIAADQKVSSINKKGCEILGYEENEIVGKNWFDTVIPERIRDDVKDVYNKLMAGEIKLVEYYENPILTKGGEERLIAWHNTLLKDEAGRTVATLSSGEDITEHRRMQEELRRSEEKYRILIDNTQDGFFIVQDGKVRFLNETLAKMIGYTVEEVIGRDFLEVIVPEDRSVVADRYRRKQAGEDTPKEYEFHLLHKDGRTRILVNMNVGIIQYLGEVASMGTVKDITEKKRLEAQLLQVQRLESIGTLAAGIAHDLNNLLSPITLSLHLLKAKLVDTENQEMLDILEKSIERAANMVKQVQSFARGAESKRTNLQIAHLISEIEQIAKETFPRNIEVRTDVPDDLWTASGDDTHLHQVLMNLCVNARDALTKGGILSISAENFFIDKSLTRMHVEAKIGPYVVITVSDTGTGIPPEIMNRMFEPFFTTKQLGKGTGLGLSTSLGIVKSHGGFINVYSEVGKGSAFKVYLPTAHASEAQTVDEQLELPVGQGELILVVEDEAMICKITKSVLETHGYKVLIANNGAEAIPLYEKRKDEVGAVIMDMMLPIMDGPQCIEALRKIKPHVKIIAVSGLDKSDSLTKGATAAQAFLPKPYTADILLKTVQKVMAAK